MRNPFKDEKEGLNKQLMVCGACSIFTGMFLISFGVGVKYIITPKVVENQIYMNLDLKEGTATWDGWVSGKLLAAHAKGAGFNFLCLFQITPPIDVLMSYYFFNVTNYDQLTEDWTAEKPSVEEIGPYAFLEHRDKKNIVELNAEHLSFDSYLAFEYHQAETDRYVVYRDRQPQ